MTAGRVVVGVGMSSRATAGEVLDLVTSCLAECGRTRADVAAVATRQTWQGDPRLSWAPTVVGVSDAALVAAAPVARERGLPARVAEAAARLAGDDALLVETRRSAYATAAVAPAPDGGDE